MVNLERDTLVYTTIFSLFFIFIVFIIITFDEPNPNSTQFRPDIGFMLPLLAFGIIGGLMFKFFTRGNKMPVDTLDSMYKDYKSKEDGNLIEKTNEEEKI